MWSSSLTRYWTQAPCIGNAVLATRPPGKSFFFFLFKTKIHNCNVLFLHTNALSYTPSRDVHTIWRPCLYLTPCMSVCLLGTSVPWQWVELPDVPMIPSNSELPPWKCFSVCEYVSRSVMSNSLWTQDYGPPGSSVRGIFQARILEWVAISFSRRSSQNRDQTQVSHIAGRFFAFWATKEARKCFRKVCKVCSWVWAMSRGGPPCAAFLTEKKRWWHSSRRGSSAISVNRVQWACFISLCKMQI